MEFDAVYLPPHKQIPLHSQDTWELSSVIIGEGARVLGDVSEPFGAGDTVLIPPGIPHCWYFNRTRRMRTATLRTYPYSSGMIS